jgi:predicted ATPase/DNA-binding SARP family transcriptional activator
VRYALLGPVEVRDDAGRSVEIGGARLLALLARLALDAGRFVAVDTLIDGLWGANPPAGAVNALQSLVSRLRRAVGPVAVIESQAAGYRLVADSDDVDVPRFERLAVEGRRALAAGDPARAAEVLTEALGLWRGPALAGVADAPFADVWASRLADLRVAAEEDRIEAAITLGRHAEVVPHLSSLSREYPLRDRTGALLVTALHRAGRQADALAAYERIRLALVEELGLDPGPELAAAHLAVLRGAVPATPPPLPAPVDDPPGNLHAQLTSFVGREVEVTEVRKLLADGRLVSLVGPGGSGKTRLAIESAAQLADRMPDGVWLVELAGVADPGEVASAALAAVAPDAPLLAAVPAAGAGRGRDVVDRLLDQLRSRRLLMILDNCEHLVEAAAALADAVLATCPGVRIMTTSREPLGITGEALYPVLPLALPADGSTADEALLCAAVRLFVDRATAVRPGFGVDDANGADVVEICRRLDGLPLAIELAAARVRALTVGQLAARLDDRFRLLTGGSRAALPRHRTLRAVVEWSWDLLTADEARLARSLSVFAGGATLGAIERICGGADPLDLLAALIDKSLLTVVEDGEVRYRMLETIRAYAAERLAESGEADAVRAAHAAYYLDLAEAAEPHLRRADQLVWLARLTEDHDNITAALRTAIDAGEADTAVRLVAALGWFWSLRGDITGVLPTIREALAIPGGSPSEARKIATAILVLSDFSDWSHRSDNEAVRRAVRDATPADPHAGHPILALVEPMAAILIDDNEAAKEAVDRRMDHPDPWVRAISLVVRGHLWLNDGDIAAAEADHAAALDLFRAVGDRWGQSASVGSLAELREMRGDRAGAVTALEESLRLVQELGAEDEVLEARIRLAIQRARGGDAAGATGALTGIHEIAQRRGAAHLVLFAEMALGEAALVDGDGSTAGAWYGRAVSGAATIGPPQMRAMLLVGQAMAATVAGDPAGARALCGQAFDDAVATEDMPVIASVAEGLAHAWAGDDAERAAALMGLAGRMRGADDRGNPITVATRDRIRETLGSDGYATAYARGAALDRDAALAYLREG